MSYLFCFHNCRLNDDSSVQWPILVNHNSLDRKNKKGFNILRNGKQPFFIAKITNIWQFLYSTSLQKEKDHPFH